MTPFTAVFQYRRFLASPESGGIGGEGQLYIPKVQDLAISTTWNWRAI